MKRTGTAVLNVLLTSIAVVVVVAAILYAGGAHHVHPSADAFADIIERTEATAMLVGVSAVLAASIAALCARTASGFVSVLSRIPVFWLAVALQILLGGHELHFGRSVVQFPTGGFAEAYPLRPFDVLYHLALPVFALTVFQAGVYAQYLRRRYSIGSIVTAFTDILPAILSADMVVELVFAWPGIGGFFWHHAGHVSFTFTFFLVIGVAIVIVRALADALGAGRRLGALREPLESL